tara:strand:- start:1678 stop:2319 length:642 start_codon:yes stop_codon:yes gene_type:complete
MQNATKVDKRVRGYLLKVPASPASFDSLLSMAQENSELEPSKLEAGLCNSAWSHEVQHPAAERFVLFHAEYVAQSFYGKSLSLVLKDEELDVKDASSLCSQAMAEFAKEEGLSLKSKELRDAVDAGKCEYLFSLKQAQECWDTQVLMFSGVGKKPAKKASVAEKAVWEERKSLALGFLEAGQTPEQIVALVGPMWGGADAVEAFLEHLQSEQE